MCFFDVIEKFKGLPLTEQINIKRQADEWNKKPSYLMPAHFDDGPREDVELSHLERFSGKTKPVEM